MQKRLLFLLIGVCLITYSYGQDRSNYKLLWEITKEGKSSKSYVFGTMHLQDERVFKFSDSVIPAIKATDVFALELDPTLVGGELSERFEKLQGGENMYRKILSEEEYELLANKFMEVNGSSIEDYPMSHPLMIEAAISPSFKNETDKRTFLDVHLFGVASHFNKEITGLEALEDQFPEVETLPESEIRENILQLIDLDEAEAKQQQERLIELYFNGSLEEIYYLVNGLGSIDAVMKSRNETIVQSMDSIMKDKTLFAGVGAAHLPGNDGVLDLLKKKGYNVRAVTATFKNPEFEYELTPTIETWKENRYKKAGYSVRTPGDALAIPMMGDVESFTVADLYSGGTFNYFHLDYRNSEYDGSKEMINKIIENQLADEGSELLSRREIQQDGKTGTEAIMKVGGETMRAQYFEIDKILYVFLIENKLNELTTQYANAFFDSILFFEPEAPSPIWELKNDALGAYSIKVKGAVKSLSREVPAPENPEIFYKLTIYTTVDVENETFNIVRYNDQPDGYYINDSSIFDEQVETLLNSRGKVISGPTAIERDGVNGASYEVIFGDNFHARAEAYFRGNRFHFILSQKTNEEEKVLEDDTFLKSFKFEPYQALKLDTVISVNNRYEVKLPQHVTETESIAYGAIDAYTDNKGFVALDEAAGGSYFFQWIETKPYLHAESLDTFYDDYAQQLLEYNDTIISSKSSLLGGLPSRQVIMHNKDTHVRQKMEFLLDGKNLILMLAYVGDAEMDRVDQYFQNFKITGGALKFDLEASKMSLISKNLKSKDSIVFEEAKGAFDYYIFDEKEEKELAALLDYQFIDSDDDYSVKNLIIDELATINSKKTLKTLVRFYNAAYSTNAAKIKVLEVLPSLGTTEAYEQYFSLLKTKAPIRLEDANYSVFQNVMKKPELALKKSEVLLSLLEKEQFRDKIVSRYAQQISYDSINAPTLKKYTDEILSYFETDAKKYVDTLQRKKFQYLTYGLISNYLTLVNNTDTLNASTKRALLTIGESTEEKSWISVRALIVALKRKVKISSTVLNDKLENFYSRYELMEALIETNNKEQITAKYLDVVEFGKLSLYNYAGEDSGYYPDRINSLGEFTYKGEIYHVYTATYLSDNIDYLGVVKSGTINLESLEPFTSFMDWEGYNDENWEQAASKLIKK
ncbi:TraB/GumN family protein [Rasiella rasia]|uniref:TraB/GumN family protein n=1 Tax=Rasiella rasia TaxID=2744027 RepID=A0A6G6GJU7_9FLAO|nr:TraB/GumN family protein [Rasiella rasia]QIE58818.1 TraB/GumN family protein [Rasiella rasia]